MSLPVQCISWFISPAGEQFLEWLHDELELGDTLTQQEFFNKHRPAHEPPVPIDPLAVMVREGRRQVYKKLVSIQDAARTVAQKEMKEMTE